MLVSTLCLCILPYFQETHDGNLTQFNLLDKWVGLKIVALLISYIFTVIGMFSVNLHAGLSYDKLFEMTAIGAIVALVLCFTFLPAAVSYLPNRGFSVNTHSRLLA